MNLSEAEKGNPSSYRPDGLVLQFHQNVQGGYKRGERYRVCAGREGERILRPLAGGTERAIPFATSERFEVYKEERVSFAIGDRIRFTLGGKDTTKKRQIANGRLDEITGIDAGGNLRLKSGMTVSRDYGHFDLGYSCTSHASQGKDRDIAIAAMGSQSLPAVNAKQLYVTVSRGRKDVAIYVDDKRAIRSAIQNAGEQLSATELVRTKPHPDSARSAVPHKHLSFIRRVSDWWRSRANEGRQRDVMEQAAKTTLEPSPQLAR